MKVFFLTLILIPFSLLSIAQAPSIQWSDCLGGSNDDLSYSIQQTADGGYIFTGTTFSNDGDVSGNHDTTGATGDIWVVKLDSLGILKWQRCLGGSGYDLGNAIQITKDGGYIVAGFTESNDGDVTGNHGGQDVWVVKLDSIGNIKWQKCLGGSQDDYAWDIHQTNDNGYIVCGGTLSNDGDVSGNHNTAGTSSDIWVVKLDSIGNIEWQKCLGGSDYDDAYSIQQTKDSGYIIAGYTFSTDGDVTGNHGKSDYWIIKLDSKGDLTWQKCLGGSEIDYAQCVQQVNDGGYIVIGLAVSTDDDVTGNFGNGDYWVVKLDTAGDIEWQKCLGGSGYDVGTGIQQTKDDKFIITGYSNSTDDEVSGNHGDEDYWEVRTDINGNLLWEKSMGGTDVDNPLSTSQTKDGGYIITGSTLSPDGDVHGLHGDTSGISRAFDCWIVKLAPDTLLGIEQVQKNTERVNVLPNPTFNLLTITSDKLSFTNIQIENVLGETLINCSLYNSSRKQTLDVSKLLSGIYFYYIIDSNSQIITGKFIKE